VRIPSLYEIFFSKLANWFRLLAKWRKLGWLKKALEAQRRRPMRLETLEPRVLLSADISYSAGFLDPALNLTLRFNESAGADVLELYNNDTSTVIDSHTIGSDTLLEVEITGGELEDTLIIDLSFAGTLDDADPGDRPALKVTFDGGDETLPADLNPLYNPDELRIVGGGEFTLAGLDIDSTETVEVAGDVTVFGDLSIAVAAVDAAQYTSLLDLVHADAVGTIDVTSGDIIADTISLTASSTLNLNGTGFLLSSAQIAIVDAHSLARVEVHDGSLTADSGGITLSATSSITAKSDPGSDADSAKADLDAAVASVTAFSDALVRVTGGTLDAAGKIDMHASNTVHATSTADGSKGGAGATLGVAVVITNTESSIGGDASVTDASSIVLTADTDNVIAVLAKSTPRGAADDGDGKPDTGFKTQARLADPDDNSGTDDAAGTSDGKLTLVGALAVSGLGSDTKAMVDSTGAIITSGALDVHSTSKNTVSAKADGSTVLDVAFDPSAASIVDTTNETIDLGAKHGLHTGDKVTYHHGAGDDIKGLTDGQPYYVNISGNNAKFYDTLDHAKAGGGSGAGGLQDLDSKGTGTAHSLELDPSATGVSIAVAINVADVHSSATVAGTVAAGEASVTASLPAVQNKFSAEAISGAGDATKTGFAGALAINIALTEVSATLGDGAVLTLSGGTGDVAIQATNEVASTAKASAAQEGSGKTGVGASVALNIGETDTKALVGDEAQITGAGNLKLSAASGNEMKTTAEGGSKGGTAVTPVVAITVSSNDTRASLGTLSGDDTEMKYGLSVSAAHKGSAETSAEGDTESGSTGVGISIALTVAVDSAVASTARDLTAGKSIAFGARSVAANDARAKASVAGGEDTPASSNDKTDQGGGVNSQVHNQSKFGDNRAATAGGSGGAAGKTDGKSSAETSKGSVQVAGAVGVTVAVSTTDASIPDGRTIKAGDGFGVTDGTLTLRAQNNTDAAASADASAVVINVQDFDPATKIDATTGETIDLGKHGLSTGDKVAFTGSDSTDGSIGLTDGKSYYVRKIDADKVALYDTEVHAKDTSKTDGRVDLHTPITPEGDYALRAGTGGGTGVGIAVAVNVADVTNKATLGDSDVTADGLTVEALVPAVVRDGETGGTSTFKFNPGDVDASGDDKTDNDTITIAGLEGLETGDAVAYHKATTEIGGLTDGKTYYAIMEEEGVVKLAASRQDALDGKSIDLTSPGTGEGHTLEFDRLHTPGETAIAFDPASKVDDVTNDTLDLGSDHGLRTGDAVVYRNGDGANTNIGNLTDGDTYYVILQGDGKIKLANSTEDAESGTAIDMTSKGTGSGHRLVFDRSHTFSAVAIAGASGGDTGVAGALAINIGLSDARAEIAGSATVKITDGGDISLVAEHFVVNIAEATANQAGASKTGVGASVALNIADTDTRALVGDEAKLTGADDLKLSAASNNEMTTEAEGGSKGATAVTPVVAISIANDDTSATLGTLVSGVTEIKGELSARAAHDGSVETVAKGDTKSGDTGVGISVALTVAIDSAIATTARDITAGKAVSFVARTVSANKAQAKASVAGGQDTEAKTKDGSEDKGGVNNEIHNQSDFADKRGTKSGADSGGTTSKTDGKSSADTKSGPVQVAGAVGVTVAVSNTKATIPDGRTIIAGNGAGVTNGTLTLKSESNTDAVTIADASTATGKGGTGIGIAVAVNVADVHNEASIGKGANVIADGLSVQAVMAAAPGFDVSGKKVVSDSRNVFSALATSGASKGDTGVAGSLAVNVGLSRTRAQVADGTTVTINDGGDVELKASNANSNTAKATAKQEDAKNVGVGASIAINIGETDTDALVGNGTAITGADKLALSAESGNNMTTSGEGGSKGDTAVTPVIVVAVSSNDTNAKLGTLSGTTSITGDFSASAAHKGFVQTVAEGSTESGDTGVGISLALTIGTDNVIASTSRNLTATGAVAFSASSTSWNESRATASVAGGDPDSKPAKDSTEEKKGGVNTEVDGQRDFADKRATQGGAEGGTTGKTEGKNSDSSSGPVQVAGAVGVTVVFSTSEAKIEDGYTVKAGGSLSLTAENNTDALALADGGAATGDGGTGVGIGIAVNYAEVHNRAIIGNDAQVTAAGLAMEAGVADRAVSIETGSFDVVDYEHDTVFVGADNGLKTGEKVKYKKSAASSTSEIGGLDDSKDYYVIDASNGKIKLAETEDKARAGTAIDLTELGSGDDPLGAGHKLERLGLLGLGLLAGDPIVFDPASTHRAVDLGGTSGLNTGDAVTYQSAAGTGDDIGGLVDGKTYYVIRLDGNNADLAASREDALAGKAITLNSAGTGNEHKLIEAESAFRAQAKSGASGGDTGVAGSVAISIANLTSEAVVLSDDTSTTSVTLTGGDVEMKYGIATLSIVSATPRGSVAADGKDLGVGASFALNIVDSNGRAEVEDDVAFKTDTGKTIGHATLTGDSSHFMITEARTGAKSSGGTAIGGAVAISYGAHDTLARLGDGTDLKLTGNLEVSAAHENRMSTITDSEASGKGAGIGVSVAIGIGVDDTRAAVAGKIDAGGAATVIATHSLFADTTAKGSAKGADGDAKNKDDSSKTSDDETKQNVDHTNKVTGDKVAAPSANDQIDSSNTKATDAGSKDDTSGSKSGSGSNIKVAAAVGVTVLAKSDSTAEIEDGSIVKAGGAVKVSATNETDATTKAIGLALAMSDKEAKDKGDSVGVAAGIGLNVVLIDNTARIGDATVQGNGITVEAVSPVGKSNDFIAWGIAGAGAQQSSSGGSSTAVAGGVGINVVDIDTTATVADSADLKSTGKVELTARSDVGTQVIGAAGAAAIGGSSGGAAVGAAVAVNVILNTTTASIGDADVDAAGEISLLSEASINPLNLLHQPIVFDGSDGGVVDAASDSFDIPNHHLTTGTEVVYHKGGADNIVIGGLTDGTHYFVRVEGSDGTFRLFDTEDHAKGDTDDGLQALSSAGTGRGHSFEKTGFDLAVTSLAAGAGVSQKGPGIAGSIAVDVFDSDTSAFIAGGALINQRNVALGITPTAAQGVSVRAHDVIEVWDLAGALAGSLESAGIGAGVDVQVLLQDTTAYIGDSALVNAGGSVTVQAEASEKQFAIAAAIGVSSDDVGIAGSIIVMVDVNHTRAYIADDAVVDANGNVVVEARQDTDVTTIAGSIAASFSSSAFGVSVSTLVHEDTVEAYIGDDAHVTARGNGAVAQVQTGERNGSGDRTTEAARGVALTATSFEDVLTIAAGFSGGSSLGIGGSVAVNVLGEDTKAWIGAGALVNDSLAGANAAQDVLLRASDSSDTSSVAGAAQYGGSGGIGGGVDVGVVTKDTYAYIADTATVKARDDVTLDAASDESVFSVAGNIGIGGFAVGISAGIYVMDTETRAYIGDGLSGHATVNAGGDVSLSADGTSSFVMIAGTVSIGTSSAGVGVSNTTLVHTDTVQAYVGTDSVVDAGGTLSLNATSEESVLTVAAAGSGGSTAGIAGSAPVQVMNEHTHAFIRDGADITAQDVALHAYDKTDIIGIGGSAGIGGSVGVGAGAEVLVLNKDTLAYIGGAMVAASGDVSVKADSSENVVTVAAALGGGTVGVSGSAGVSVLTITTRSFIGDDIPTDKSSLTSGKADVAAEGNVIVTSTGETHLTTIAGAVGVGSVGVGASAAVTVVNKTTEAYLGRNAEVTGKGNNATSANTGRFGTASFAAYSGSEDFGGLSDDGKSANNSIGLSAPNTSGVASMSGESSNDTPDNDSLTGKRNVAPVMEARRGVVVTATNKDDVNTAGVAVGGGTVGVSVSGTVNVITANTNAFIAEGARVNQDTSGTIDAGQGVLVAAANDFHHMGIVGSVGAGFVGVTANADVTLTNLHTNAYIDDGAWVDAKGNIEVTARSHEDVLSLAFAVGAGFVGVSAPNSIMVINSTTHAYIGNNAITDGGGAKVDANGSVLVSAKDDTDAFVIVGSVAAGAVGVGGSVSVLLIDKDTGAWVGDHAAVDAKGHGTALTGLSDGTLNDSTGSFGHESLRGLAVEADSSEQVFVIAASAAFGGYAGIGGGIAYEGIHSKTHATIGDGADINQALDNNTADVSQSVSVSALNDAHVFAFGGGIATGVAGIGGGVNVGVIRNDVEAGIKDADVQARSNVDVNALGNKDIETIAISAAGGGVAIAGSVSVWSIGDAVSSSYSAEQRDGDGNKTGEESDNALDGDSETPTRSFNTADISDDLDEAAEGPTQLNRQYDDTIHFASAHGYETGDRVVYHAPTGEHAVGGLSDGATYYVIKVNDNDIRLARNNDDADDAKNILLDKSLATGSGHQFAGSTAESGASGAESQTGEFANSMQSYKDPGTGSKTDEGAHQQSLATQSAAAGISANNPSGKTEQVMKASGDAAKAGTTAYIADGATVSAGDSVGVRAKERIEFNSFAGTASVGAVGIGAGISIVTIGSKVDAYIGDATITAGSGLTDGVTVQSALVTDITGKAWGGQAGGVAVGAQVVVVHDNSQQFAHINGGAEVRRAGDKVLVEARADRQIDAQGVGLQFAGVAVGASIAVVDVGGQTEAWVDGDIGQTVGMTVRDVEISAVANTTANVDTIQGAVGIGFGLTGAVAIANVDTTVEASTGSASDIKATRNVTVATGADTDAEADAIAGTLSLGGALGASLALASARPTLTTRVSGNIRTTGAGTVLIKADSDETKAHANALSVAGGLLLGAAGAIAIADTSPDREAYLDSSGKIEAAGNVTIQAGSTSTADARAAGGGLSLFAGIGVSFAQAHVGGTVDAHSDGTITATTLTVQGNSTNDADAKSYAVAGGLLGVGFNVAMVDIDNTTKARLGENSKTDTVNDVTVLADAHNIGHAKGFGVTVGGIAIGGMIVDVDLGKGKGSDEVIAEVGNNAAIDDARFVTITARSTDELFAEGQSAGGGLITVTGADVSTSTDQSAAVRIGTGAEIIAQAVTLLADHSQDVDAKGNSVAFGLAAGGGAVANNTVLGKATVDIGANAEITGHNVVVSAKNELDKEHFGVNLQAASASAVGVSALFSKTKIGTSGDKFQASVNIGSGAHLMSVGDNANPGILRIEALNDIRALDSVEVEGFSLIGAVTLGESEITTNTLALVSIDGATVENKAGDVDLTTKTNIEARTDVDLTVASGLTGVVNAVATVVIVATDTITLNNATVKGQDVSLYAGRDAYGQVNLIDGFANTDIMAFSLLPNISVPDPDITITENNNINILGASKVQALEDVVLRAIEGLGGSQRGTTDGAVLSLSLIPYGVSVPDGAHADSFNTVKIATTAKIEAGVNNQSLVQLKPIKLGGVFQQVPGGGDLVKNRLDTPLTADEKDELGLAPEIAYEFARLDLDAIPFSISTGTIVQRVAGAGVNGIVGHYYKFLPVSESTVTVVLEQENFSNASRWQDLDSVAPAADENTTVYASNVTSALLAAMTDKFYVIKPVELDAPSFVYKNLGNLLLEQREKVLDWIQSHGSDPESVARYQVQLELINDALDELGLVETINGVTIIKRELDVLFVEIPNVYATPGSVFIDGNSVRDGTGAPTTVNALITAGAILPHAGAKIEILNQTPFTMQVNDAVIKDTKRVTVVDGQYTVLQPGNVYYNNTAVTDNTGSAEKNIFITQDSFPQSQYDIDTSALPGFTSAPDQDLYLVGDIINEVGDVHITNLEGSIIVSGEIRAAQVFIQAARDFSLNSDDWFHTNRDPRQYLDFDDLRALVFHADGSSDTDTYATASKVAASVSGTDSTPTTLQAQINVNESKILAQGQIAITARFLNIDGLIQSGVQTVTLHIGSGFVPNSTGSLVDDDGNAVAGVSFGTDGAPVDAYFDFAQNAIVLDDLVPEGGRIILAGQILSTGNGQIKAAYGHANVDIVNESGYDLIVNRIDTTRDRTGKITIIDTARIVDGAANDQA